MSRKLILLGHIAGAHGIRGEVLIKSYTEVPEDIAAYGPLFDETGDRQFKLAIKRASNKGLIARIQGVDDRTAAQSLKGTGLYVDREKLPESEDDEFYHEDLIGLTARHADGTEIGEIVAVQNYGAGDLLEIRLKGTKRTELIPFADPFVTTIDVAAGYAVVQMTDRDD